MMVQWFDCAASMVSFSSTSLADAGEISAFKHMLVRLFSLLHALALVELERGKARNADEFTSSTLNALPLIEQDLDHDFVKCLLNSQCKTEVVYTWIQNLLVKNQQAGVLSVPPPILTRGFQELATGMNHFHECSAISDTPFPFPYSQTTAVLLVLHLVVTPPALCALEANPIVTGLMAFLLVFVLWSLFFIAAEIEDPFGIDDNDLDAPGSQEQFNVRLIELTNPILSECPKGKSAPAPEQEEFVQLSSLFEIPVQPQRATFFPDFPDLLMKTMTGPRKSARCTQQGPVMLPWSGSSDRSTTTYGERERRSVSVLRVASAASDASMPKYIDRSKQDASSQTPDQAVCINYKADLGDKQPQDYDSMEGSTTSREVDFGATALQGFELTEDTATVSEVADERDYACKQHFVSAARRMDSRESLRAKSIWTSGVAESVRPKALVEVDVIPDVDVSDFDMEGYREISQACTAEASSDNISI